MRSFTDEPQRATQGLITSGFPDVHAVKRSCLVPPKAMSSLSTSRNPLPSHPGPRTTEPPRPANFTHFEALIPLRVRSRQPERTRIDGRYSLGFLSPSETLTDLGASTPPSSEELDTCHHPEALARGTKGSSPRHQVRPSQRSKPRQVRLSQRPDRFRPDCTASRRQLLLP